MRYTVFIFYKANASFLGFSAVVPQEVGRREFPFKPGSHGEFWGGGRSFPSGHAATSTAFASAIARRYPHNRWVKWGACAFASGVALSRYPAKRHYLSDILVGSALGYVTGTYVARH